MLSPLVAVHKLEVGTANISDIWKAVNICLKLGRINESLTIAYNAAQKDASQQQLYGNHYIKAMRLGAELAEEIGNHHQTEHYWQQLTKYVPNNIEAWYGLAVARANLEKYEEARQAASQVLQLDPEYQKVRSLLIYIQQHLQGSG